MDKFKINKNFSKKVISIALSSVIVLTTLVGCSNSKIIAFKGDNLKNVSVVTLDDNNLDVANKVSYCSPRVCSGEHEVYKSVVSGEMFTNEECNAKSSADYLGTTLNKYSVEEIQNIVAYLTLEEIEKANKNQLTEEDISNIISRIFDTEIDIVKTKKAN